MEVESTVELNEDVKEKLIELDESHLDKLNPYGLEKIGDEETYPELDKIIKQFLEYHKGNADGVFSWVKELNKLAEEKKGKKFYTLVILLINTMAYQHM